MHVFVPAGVSEGGESIADNYDVVVYVIVEITIAYRFLFFTSGVILIIKFAMGVTGHVSKNIEAYL